MLLLIFVGGVFLRAAMMMSGKSLWGDEFFSIELALRPLAEVLKGSVNDVHPPLYFVALHAAIRTFGESEWVFRLVSFAASCGTLAMIYFLGKKFFTKQAAFIAFLLAAISPYWLQSSNEVRGYSLLAFFSSLTIYAFLKALESPGRKRWVIAYVLSALGTVYTEHYGWFVFFSLVAALWAERSRKDARKLWAAHGSILLLGSASLVIIIFQAIFREHMFQSHRVLEYFSFPILLKKSIGTLWHFANGYSFSMLTAENIAAYVRNSPFFWLSALSAFFSTTMLGLGLLGLYREKRTLFILSFICTVLAFSFLVVFYAIRCDARYLSFAAPIFFILVGGGIASLKTAVGRYAILSLLVAVSLMGAVHTISLKTDPIHKEDYRGLIAYVFQKAQGKDVVCGLSPQVFYYKNKLGPLPPVTFVPEVKDLSNTTIGEAQRIWIMDIVNMHPEVSERIFGEKKEVLQRLGFRPAQEPVRFGGDGSLLAVYLFEKI